MQTNLNASIWLNWNKMSLFGFFFGLTSRGQINRLNIIAREIVNYDIALDIFNLNGSLF